MSMLGKKAVISALAIGVVAASSITSYASTPCGHDYPVDRGTYVKDVTFYNPDCHMIEYETEYSCGTCGVFWWEEAGRSYELHDYELDYETNILTCNGCGDSYGW